MKEELLNFLTEKNLNKHTISIELLDAICEFIDLKFNDSFAQLEASRVRENEQAKEFCECTQPYVTGWSVNGRLCCENCDLPVKQNG